MGVRKSVKPSARRDSLPGSVKVMGTTYVGTRALIPLSLLFVHPQFQRCPRPHQVARMFGGFDWWKLGTIYVHAAWKWIDPVMRDLFHVSEGGTRLWWLRELFPDGKFTQEHADADLIPDGCNVGDDVMVDCCIVDQHPIDTFIQLNKTNKIKLHETVAVKLHAPDRFPAETELVNLFQKFGIKVLLAGGRCAARRNPDTTVSAHQMLQYFTDNRSGLATAEGRRLVKSTLEVITEVYRRPSGRGIIEYAALNYVFMWAVCEVIRDSGYDLRTIKEALTWAYEELDERAEFILNNPENNGSGGDNRKTRVMRYIVDLIRQYENRD